MAPAATGHARPVAVLDACVLVPPGLRDVLLSCAGEKAFRPVWQHKIVEEMTKNGAGLLVKNGISQDDADKALANTETQMAKAFPDAALAKRKWKALEKKMTCDPKDRHVMAAAAAAKATHLVTSNLKDFPKSSWVKGVDVLSPDAFLNHLLATNETAVIAAVVAMSKRQRRPAQTPQQIAERIAGGQFAASFGKALVDALD